jgi:hypothetical protein
MPGAGLPVRDRLRPLTGWVVLATSLAVALGSARPYAGGWNDGSRLATVECLVDYHTLAIDHSIFVESPPPETPQPYPADEPNLRAFGTGDKLLVQGHFYSDKSPVPAVLLACVYSVFEGVAGQTARTRPDSLCYWLTVASSGLAYVTAVWCLYQLGGLLRLTQALRLALTASFAGATVALPYVRHVNNHILLLGVTAAVLLGLVRLAEETKTGIATWLRLLELGTLTGLGYTVDLGAGPVLLLCTFALVAFRCPRLKDWTVLGLAALPWLVLHHAVNYAVGGTFKPANAVPEYFQWPGCGFNPQNMTGSWNHPSIGAFLVYAAGLLLGKRGFLNHNLPLFLALPALVILLWRGLASLRSGNRLEALRRSQLPELLYAGCCSGGIWLAYALTSTNYAGLCCSIRWFVPLLAPGYFVLAVFLRDNSRLLWVFLTLSAWGAVQAAIMWYEGPWMKHMVPFFWWWQGAALLSLLIGWWWRRHPRTELALPLTDEPSRSADAA